MRDIYHAVVGSSDLLKILPDDILKDYRNSCGDAASGIISALTALGDMGGDTCENEEYSEEECKRDMRNITSALRHLPRLIVALEQNRENADFEMKRREATK